MYVCVCVCVCIHTHIYMYIYIYNSDFAPQLEIDGQNVQDFLQARLLIFLFSLLRLYRTFCQAPHFPYLDYRFLSFFSLTFHFSYLLPWRTFSFLFPSSFASPQGPFLFIFIGIWHGWRNRWQNKQFTFIFPPQGHFIGAMARVAEKLAREDNVVGFDSLNEPNLGMAGNVYIPYPHLNPNLNHEPCGKR